MATKPNPRLLPKVTYAPARGGEVIAENNQDWRKGGGGEYVPPVLPPFFPPAQDPVPNANPVTYNSALFGGASQVPQWGGASQVPPTPDILSMTPPNASPVTYNPALFGEQVAGTPNAAINARNAFMNTPSPTTDYEVMGDASLQPRPTDDVARTQDAVNKNQRLTQQAKDTGNDKELARLQAEWDRIAPMAQKYGITAERLVNSYMQPGNAAAESSLERAMGKAIADDTWANAATIAFGRPPNQLEWDEHWRAMNKGGRDPLEGHPQAIQAIQQRMQEIQQDNQKQAFGQYQQWLNSQT